MNYDYYESTLLACMVIDEDFYDRVPLTLIEREDFKALYKFIKDTKIKTLSDLYAKIDGHWGKYDFTEFAVQTVFKTVRTMNNAEIEFCTAIDRLGDRHQADKILETIIQAGHYVKEGSIDTGISVLQGIEYKSKKRHVSAFMGLMGTGEEQVDIFPTGIRAIDDLNGGFDKGNLYTIAGGDGTMKTRVSLYLLFNILRANPNFKAVYFEKEMTESDLISIIISQITGKPYGDIIKAENSDKAQIQKMIIENIGLPEHQWLKDGLLRTTIITGESFDTALEMMKFVRDHEADVWVLDYFTCLGESSPIDSHYTYWEAETKQLKKLARVTKSCGIILAQLKQNTVTSESRVNKIATKSDIEYGFKLAQLCSGIYATFHPCLHYASVESSFYYLIPLKNRRGGLYYPPKEDGTLREPFFVPLLADPAKGEFKEPNGFMKERMSQWLKGYNEKHHDKSNKGSLQS